MADVGGMLYDKDAVYIDIPDWKVQYSRMSDGAAAGDGAGGDASVQEGEAMVRQLQTTQLAMDEKLAASKIRMFQVRGRATACLTGNGWQLACLTGRRGRLGVSGVRSWVRLAQRQA